MIVLGVQEFALTVRKKNYSGLKALEED